jgi:predicted transcriptional regulator
MTCNLNRYLDAYRRNALNAWAEYQETGLYLDAEEVMAWLETWGDDSEISAPKLTRAVPSERR